LKKILLFKEVCYRKNAWLDLPFILIPEKHSIAGMDFFNHFFTVKKCKFSSVATTIVMNSLITANGLIPW